MEKNFSYCGQVHQVDLCKTCARNFKLLKNQEIEDIVDMTIFTPNLIPNTNCIGYIKNDKEIK